MTSAAINIEAGQHRKWKRSLLSIFGSLLFVAVIINTSIGYVEYIFYGKFGNTGRILFWIVLGLSLVITLAFSKRSFRLLALMFIALIVCSRVMRTLSPAVLIVYQLTYMLTISLASAVYFRTCKEVYEKWLKIFLVINFVLLTLQMLGVSEIFHMWNTQFIDPDNVIRVELHPTLFVSADDLIVRSQQIRPSGIFYANAICAAFLVMAIGHRIGGSMLKFTTYDLIIILSVFLAMAKIGVLFLCLMAVIRYFSCNANEKAARRKFLLVIPGVILLWYILFPGILISFLYPGQFFFSAGVRVADFLMSLGIENIPIIGDNIRIYAEQAFSLRYENEGEIGSLSGIRYLGLLVPLLFFSYIVLKKRFKHALMPYEVGSMAKYLMVAFVFNFLATAVIGSTLLGFMLGPAMVGFFNTKNIQSPTTQRRKLEGGFLRG